MLIHHLLPHRLDVHVPGRSFKRKSLVETVWSVESIVQFLCVIDDIRCIRAGIDEMLLDSFYVSKIFSIYETDFVLGFIRSIQAGVGGSLRPECEYILFHYNSNNFF